MSVDTNIRSDRQRIRFRTPLLRHEYGTDCLRLLLPRLPHRSVRRYCDRDNSDIQLVDVFEIEAVGPSLYTRTQVRFDVEGGVLVDVMDDELGELALMWQSAPMLRSAKVKVAAGMAASSDSASEHSPPGVVRSDPFPSPPVLVTPVPEAHASAEPIFETTLDEGVSLEHLEAEICSLAGRLASSTCDWLRLIAEFDRRKGWAQWGVRSCAHWLAWACSVAPVAAREYVRVAN